MKKTLHRLKRFAEKIRPPRYNPLQEIGGSGGNLLAKYGLSQTNPDTIIASKGVEAFEDMEQNDGHYLSVLQSRKLGLLAKGWMVQPASVELQDVEMAEFVQYNLNRMEGSFLQDLLELLDALGKGFSVSEIVYETLEGGDWDGKVGLRALKHKDQANLGFDLDEFDNVKENGLILNPIGTTPLFRQNTTSAWGTGAVKSSGIGSDLDRHLPYEKFIHFTFGGRAGNPYGRGVGHPCYWYSWFKREGGFKFWLIFLEKFGMPTVAGKIPKGVSETDVENLRAALNAIKQETSITIPEGFEIELLEAKRAGEAGYSVLIETCNAEISKAVLGATLTSESGRRGARSLGEIHQEVRYDFMMFDADLLATVINEQLIHRLVDFNYITDHYPIFSFNVSPPKDLEMLSRTVERLVKSNLPVGQQWAHETFGIPEPQEGEAVLSAPTPGPGAFAEFAEAYEKKKTFW